jgi:membrane protein YqaA with SNARE-associated domain
VPDWVGVVASNSVHARRLATADVAREKRERCAVHILVAPAGEENFSGRGVLIDRYILVAAVVLGVNLLPAFGPPTWAVLVLFRVNSHIPVVPLVLVGALSAASGRFLLATLSRRFRSKLSDKRRTNLQFARNLFGGSRRKGLAALALFALSPIPSAQLFMAAGLLDVALIALTAAFFVGRLVSYSIYVSAASLADHQLGALIRNSLTSPLGVAIQVLMLAALVSLVRVDWAKVIRWLENHGPRRRRSRGRRSEMEEHDRA